jgi:large subunit ribosomal protein L19
MIAGYKEESNMNIIEKITKKQLNPNVPEFRVGDTINVGLKITEKSGEKTRERIQNFEGIVVSRKGSGVNETFTVRKKSSGVGVERILPVHSPKIASIEVVKRGKVRRAKLHFLRSFVGQFKIKERN